MLTPPEIARSLLAAGESKARLPFGKMLLLAILAGAYIALAGVGATAAAVTVESGSLAKLLSACVFPAGLSMVILAGSELFTGNCLMVMALLERRITPAQLLRNWLTVYLGNAMGGAAVAAAVAGAIAGESDPAIPLGGAELKGVDGLEARYGDTEIDTLVRGGVTPVEQAAGVVSVVRGVTTRTKTGEAADATWRELTTIRIVDDVIPTVRDALRARFRRAKNTEQSRGAIRSQVVLELENKLAREIITGYGEVSVEADADNPTVCLVDFSFTVAHGLNQIWLSAHITV